MTIVETRPITGGVDTHLDVHVAAALDANGGVLGVESFPTTTAGFAELARLAVRRSARWAGSGWRAPAPTGPAWPASCAAPGWRWSRSIARTVRPVAGTASPTRVDAVEAARAALSGRAHGVAKTADGNVEAIRALLVAHRSGRDVRIKCLNQIRHLGFTAPDELRERFRGVTVDALAETAAALRPNPDGDPVVYATKLAMQTLGRRVLDIDADNARLHDELTALVQATAPSLVELYGVGTHTAALLLVAAGDNAERITLRGRLRPPLRGRPDPRLIGQDDPAPAQPRRQPPSQPRPVADRVHPHELGPAHPRLRRTAHRRRTQQARDHARPQALRRPRGLPPPPTRVAPTIGVAGLTPECPDATGCPANDLSARHSTHRSRHRMA